MDLRRLVREALDEDIGPGDLTTEATVPVDAVGTGALRAKQDLVVCGHRAARAVFAEVAERTGGGLTYDVLESDGAFVPAGTVIAHLGGSLRTLLMGERVALNFLMKLSGIASHVRRWVQAAAGSELRVVDTRKTTPLHRGLEKYAVRTGGGHNHRFALYDGVLIKDNHIAAVGGITEAVRRARAHAHHLVRIEIEVGSVAGLEEALRAGVDVVLLDNMTDAQLRQCVQVAEGQPVLLEASGNMGPERIAGLVGMGIDLVSAGGLIHQATWADLSLKIVQQ